MPIAEAFAVLEGSIALIPPTIDVVKKLKKTNKSPSLTRVVDTFSNDTIEASVSLQISIDEIENILRDLDFDLTKRINENHEALRFWDLEKSYFLNRVVKKIRAIQSNLRSSVEDVGRILMCRGKFESMEGFDFFVRAVSRELNSIEDRPIRDILDTYRRWLEEFKTQLRD